MASIQKITPFLWFDNQAEEAAKFYVSLFRNSKMGDAMHQNGSVLVANFSLDGQRFSALNGGPLYKLNQSISLFVLCETEAETDTLWQRLADGGQVMIPLEPQAWSEKYGWVQDRFGLSWQVSLGKMEEVGQKFTPTLLFTGSQRGRAEEAVRLYTSLFSDSSVKGILRYEAGEEGPVGTVKHAQFSLCGQTFMAMDNPTSQDFTFNEAFSLMVHCDNQEEVDYFSEKLIADGGEESMCGWLKDKFGVSWQITPDVLLQLVSDPDPAKAQRAMSAMLQMRKIDIAKLIEASEATSATITVETMVNAPIDKVWRLWTEPEHVKNWNNASDDWHTPKAVNDLRTGGRFVYTMAAKDGSFSFDFGGVYDDVVENQRLAYTIGDGRKVNITFRENGGGILITEEFDPENVNSHDMQRAGWQAILDNFKKYAEGTI